MTKRLIEFFPELTKLTRTSKKPLVERLLESTPYPMASDIDVPDDSINEEDLAGFSQRDFDTALQVYLRLKKDSGAAEKALVTSFGYSQDDADELVDLVATYCAKNEVLARPPSAKTMSQTQQSKVTARANKVRKPTPNPRIKK
jgi:hypothetical protein